MTGSLLDTKNETGRARHRRRGVKALAAGAAAATVVAGGVLIAPLTATADEKTVTSVSAAHGHGLYTNVAGLPLAATADALQEWDPDSTNAPVSDELQVDLLGIPVNLGNNVTIPLISQPGEVGLLDLGSLGAISSYANAPAETNSVASSGLITEQGGLDLTAATDPDFEPAKLDVSALLEQLAGNAGRAVLDEGSIQIGALGARASKVDGAVTSEYMLAGAELELQSPLVASVATQLDNVLRGTPDPITGVRSGGVGGTLNAAVATDGVLGQAVAGLPDLNLGIIRANLSGGTIGINGLDIALDEASQELLADPLVDPNGIVEVWLADSTDGAGNPVSGGTVRVDLSKVVDGGDLNGLDPNTLLLDSTTLTRITTAVNDALGTLSTKVVDTVTAVVNNLDVHLALPADLLVQLNPLSSSCSALGNICVGADITVDAKLGQLTGAVLGAPTVGITLDDEGLLGAILAGLGVDDLAEYLVNNGLLTPITTALSPVISGLLTTITTGLPATLNGITTPVLNTLGPVLGALNSIVQVTINEQPTVKTPAEAADLGAGSFTVRALKINVLGNVLPIELGSASVKAAEPVATLVATPERVAHDEEVTLAGTHFEPNSTVTITIPGVATPITAPTDGSGAFTTTWTVPAGFDLGAVVISANDGTNTATDTVTVVDVAIAATDAPQGGTVQVTGGEFVAGETVTITLPGGGTTTVTAGTDGTISYDWTVPATQTPGSVSFTAEGESGRTATDTATISLAAATLTPSPTIVEPGGTVTLTGGNFAPGEEITVTLPADCVLSGTMPSNADASGAFTVTCVVDAGAEDGDVLVFSAVGDDSGRSATASVDVADSVDPDANTNASASAAASAQANGNNEIAAQAAAQAAAMADNSTDADAAATADAEAAARSAAQTTASTNASTDATTTTNAAARASAQASVDSTASANANADAGASVAGSVDARAASQASSNVAANATSSNDASADATANVRANANASASASASARANGDNQAAAQVAAQAAAYSQNDSDASAAATADATSAAEAAAYTDVDTTASADASAEVTSNANVAAQAAAQTSSTAQAAATAQAEASADHNADSEADGSFDSRSAARSAAEASSASDAHTTGSADAAVNAAANVQANANASASASASADADNHSNPAAVAAALAAAMANNDTAAEAAATPNAQAAAQSAARPNANATASTTASATAESEARAAAQSTADVDSAQAAQASATTDVNAEASSAAAAQATASTEASSLAAADVNASASASASAKADSKANAAAQAAAETAAMANATTTASASVSAAATANAEAAARAAAQIAARADIRQNASANASQNTSAQANVAATAAAQASADHSASVNAAASAQAKAAATANASAAAEAAARQGANVDSTASASASAAANATASASGATPGAAQAASEGAAKASGNDLARTGAAVNGLVGAGILLLLAGAATFALAKRRTQRAAR